MRRDEVVQGWRTPIKDESNDEDKLESDELRLKNSFKSIQWSVYQYRH